MAGRDGSASVEGSVKRKRSALVDGELHMTWQHGRAVGRRRVWWWWPADWYRLAVDREFRYWLRKRGCGCGHDGAHECCCDTEWEPSDG